MSCFEYIDNITSDKPTYKLLFYINPVNTPAWQERSAAWDYAFIAITALYSFIFFMIGMVSLVLLIKKDCWRLKTKTFLAIYTCLIVLGFSRGLFLSLDPYGILGWLADRFEKWTIITRVLVSLGFPSLTASYTLVFLSLYKAPAIDSTRHWHRHLWLVLVVALTPYVLALVAETVANVAPYPALSTTLACDAFFIVWGVCICVFYVFAGSRLLHKLKVNYARSLSPRLERGASRGFISEEHSRRYYDKISGTFRKIGLITYFTAILGILYSVVSFANLALLASFAFYSCFGFNGLGDPTPWLVLKAATYTLEIPLALVMLYSVTDFSSVVAFMCCKRSYRTTCIHHSTALSTVPTSKSHDSLSTSQSMHVSFSSLELGSTSAKGALNARPALTKMILHSNTNVSMDLPTPI